MKAAPLLFAAFAVAASCAGACPAKWEKYLAPPKAYADFPRSLKLRAAYDCGEFVVEVYDQANGPGTTQCAMMAVPKSRGAKLPAVVVPFYFPEAMLGFDPANGSRKATRNGMDADLAFYDGIDFMAGLARRGYVTICADAYHLTYAATNAPANAWAKWKHAGEALARDWPNWTGVGKLAFDTRLLVDAVAADVRVDSNRIGIVGHSLGGKMAFYAGCLDPRVKAIAASDFGIGWDQTNWKDAWYWGAKEKLARAEGLDHSDLLAAADKPFMLVAGQYDNADSFATIRKANLGADKTVFLNHATGHRPPREAVEATYDFLDRHLRALNRRSVSCLARNESPRRRTVRRLSGAK